MPGKIESRLKQLGIALPAAAAPAANYVPFAITGNQLWVAGQITFWDGKLKYLGKVGTDLSLEDGAAAALSYAFRFMYMPVGIFGVSVATAAIPELARHAATRAHVEMRTTVSWGLRLMLMLSVPATLGLVTLATASDTATQIPNLGASGAVSAVLGAYFVLLPNARVLTLFFFVIIFFMEELPAWIFLAVYFILQAWEAGFQLQHPPEGGGTAVFAHVGGIAFGFLTVKLFQSRRPLRPRL